MDNNELNKLEALAKAATPGPWRQDGFEIEIPSTLCNVAESYLPKDAAFIAATNPAVILQLIALARRSLPVDVTGIKTWQERAKTANDWPVYDGSTVAEYMALENADLRAALARAGIAADTGQAEPVASIETDEFNRLLGTWMESRDYYQSEDQQETKDAWAAFIAHINKAKIAAPVSAGIAAPAAPTDEQIVAALHSCGIDTRPSKYGFDALQVDSTSVPSLRAVFQKLLAAPTAAERPSLDAYEMTRLRRLMAALGDADSFKHRDDYVRGVLCTVLGQAAGKIESAAPLPTKEGAGEVDAIPKHREPRSSDPREQAHAAGWNACREAMISAIATQPKDTTDTRRDA